jgi:ATP-dependent Lhr-like helicase
MFAGRALQFVRFQQMVVQVRRGRNSSGLVPRWMGGKLPMSSSLAKAVRQRLEEAAGDQFADEEMRHIRPILELQRRWSQIPLQSRLLIESVQTRDGQHHYVFPFQGRLVHEGLSALITFRLANAGVGPVTATFNDYGIELLSPQPVAISADQWRRLLSVDRLVEDVLLCVNSGELARRHFREIARIAGLLVTARPGAPRSVRQLQASSELFYDVFREFDPENLLLDQARREVLERQLEFTRLRKALSIIEREELSLVEPVRLSPLAFPLWAERIASQTLRHESARQRIERLASQLEKAANATEAAQ